VIAPAGENRGLRPAAEEPVELPLDGLHVALDDRLGAG
jgi:hypothetical protein